MAPLAAQSPVSSRLAPAWTATVAAPGRPEATRTAAALRLPSALRKRAAAAPPSTAIVVAASGRVTIITAPQAPRIQARRSTALGSAWRSLK